MPSDHFGLRAGFLRELSRVPQGKYYSNHLASVRNELKYLKPYQIDTKFAQIDQETAEIEYIAIFGTPQGPSRGSLWVVTSTQMAHNRLRKVYTHL